MACLGSSELAEYDFEGKNGVEALSELSKCVAGTGIRDACLPTSVLAAAEDPEKSKDEFLRFIRNMTSP